MPNARLIKSPEMLHRSLETLSSQASQLAELVTGQRLSVPILKLFAYSDEEYTDIKQLILKHGQRDPVSSSTSYYVRVSDGLCIQDTPLVLLGVRKPDPTKPYIGCGDYIVPNFTKFAAQVMSNQPEHAKLVQNTHGLTMLELHHPDFDVLGYVIPE